MLVVWKVGDGRYEQVTVEAIGIAGHCWWPSLVLTSSCILRSTIVLPGVHFERCLPRKMGMERGLTVNEHSQQ